MKTIYSLNKFHEKASEIANAKDVIKDHVAVSVEYGLFGKFEFNCYASGYSWHKGGTMEESLKKLHDAINPQAPVKQQFDVEIEVEQ